MSMMASPMSRTTKSVSFVTEQVIPKSSQGFDSYFSYHQLQRSVTTISKFSDSSTQAGDDAYTVFTAVEKRLVIIIVSLAGVLSTLTASIYYPSLVDLTKSLSVSTQLINVTVAAYLVMQGVIPTIIADVSECKGRRPVYIVAFAVYCGASLGLAFQTNYAALLVLRVLQSAGASGTIALAHGTIADLASSPERARYISLASIGWYAANGFGPVLGGIFTQFLGWRWVFRFLAIISGISLIVFALILPETSRKVVGNGSRVAQGINQSLVSLVRQSRSARARPTSCAVLSPFATSLQHCQHQHRLRFPNPLHFLRLVFQKASFLLLLSNAIFFLQFSCMQVSLAPLLQSHYGLNTLQSGLCYLAYGIPAGVAAYVVGKISNHDYAVTARQHNIWAEEMKGDSILGFPIEQARLRSVWYYVLLAASATIAYGWAMQMRWHLSVVLITQVLSGVSVTGILVICNTLMIDWQVDDADASPVHACAAVSITQCLLAAGGVAVLDVSFKHIDIGWTFSIIGGLCYITILLFGIVNLKGWNWRKDKALKGVDLSALN